MAVTINDRNLFVKLGDCFIAPDYTISQVTNFPIPNGYEDVVGVELWSNYSEKTLSELFKKLIYVEGIDYDTTYKCYLPSEKVYNYWLSRLLSSRFGDKWARIVKELNKEYESLKPLQLKTDNQLLEDKLKSTNKVTATRKTTGTDSNENETIYDKNDNKVFGFNSTVGVNSDSSDNTSKDTSVTTTDLTNTTNDSTDYSRDLSSHRIVERAGNIGNRLPSEMLEKEIEFRKYQIVDTIVNDILSVLTRSKYI